MTRKCGEKLERHPLDPYNMDIFERKDLKDAKGLYSNLLRFARVFCVRLERG
ncbi:MAG: hypothetical protein ABIL70_09210 [candidate division WOR-3 bacterium]